MSDPLTRLLDNAQRQASHRSRGNTFFIRDRITPPKKNKISTIKSYSDFERFQFYFNGRDGKTLQQWRKEIDGMMERCKQFDVAIDAVMGESHE